MASTNDRSVQREMLRLMQLSEIIAPSRLTLARRDLQRYAQILRSMATILKPLQHAAALTWVSEWRMYCFERSVTRWSDARFHLVDREYLHWRGHQISFTAEQLDEFGCTEWDRRAVSAVHGEEFVPLEDDSLDARRHLRRYARLVTNIANGYQP